MTKVIVALDLPGLGPARDMAERLRDEVDGFKVGLELLTAAGPAAIEDIARLGKPVFADAKLHDIPNTVLRAAANLASAGARWLTAHAAGGSEMLEAAVTGMGGGGVLAVTVLTSLSHDDDVTDMVVERARLAAAAGAEGLVCSPWEAAAVRGMGLTVFTPGIRPAGSETDDQRRVATPEEAIAAGADYLVIGRPITRASDPIAAAREIGGLIARVDA